MSYTILGRQIATEYLAIGTFLATGLGVYAGTRKATPPAAAAGQAGPAKVEPKIEAGSKEEEDFIRQFIAEAEKEDGAHH